MKLKLLLAVAAGLLLLGAAHVYFNVGVSNFLRDVRTMLGGEKHEQLVVGFLPVT